MGSSISPRGSVKRCSGEYVSIIRAKAGGAYTRYGSALAIGTAFLLPIRLLPTYFCLIPLVVLWLLKPGEKLRDGRLTGFNPPEAFLLVLCTFLLISAFGREPVQSLRPLFSLFFFSIALFVFRDMSERAGPKPFLLALILGQTLASLNTAIAAIFPTYPRLLIGQVSESGQLALTLIVALGVLMSEIHGPPENPVLKERVMLLAPLSLLFAFFLALLCFSESSALPLPLVIVSGTLVTVVLLLVFVEGMRRRGLRFFAGPYAILLCSLPFMFVALLSNLKRGPWAGVLFGTVLFAFVYARKVAAGILILAVIVLMLFQPVRTRLLESPEDFFIAGGRSEIWQIGGELIRKYPLGLGFKNSRVLQQYSTLIPSELKHFHNNFLNITAETGWIGLGVFVWWILSVLLLAYRPKREVILARAITCALISWQVAGFVEYNFGDSEVLLVAFMLIGVLSALKGEAMPEPARAG